MTTSTPTQHLKRSYSDWRRGVLAMVGARATPQNLRFLSSWQRREGGHTHNSARFNWLNTTMNAPGAVGSMNSVGVKRFRDQNSGINALALTLMNGRYQDILKGLKSGNPYDHDLTAGLSTWVSGSPTGNVAYARKVMGMREPKSRITVQPAVPTQRELGGIDLEPLNIAFADDPEFLAMLKQVYEAPEPTAVPGPELEQGTVRSGKRLVLPTRWSPTHPTDGLGWGTNTAVDIMATPGTIVGAPEAGVVMKWNPTGAQGGGSMYFRADSGKTYWLGHIANGLKPGTKVRRGQRIAIVSSDHPRPHVHMDVR